MKKVKVEEWRMKTIEKRAERENDMIELQRV